MLAFISSSGIIPFDSVEYSENDEINETQVVRVHMRESGNHVDLHNEEAVMFSKEYTEYLRKISEIAQEVMQ